MIQWVPLIICLIVPQAVGGLSAWIAGNGMQWMQQHTIQPALQPPGVVFPIVWTTLFFLMGIASYLVVVDEKASHDMKKDALLICGAQLIVNFLWNIFYAVLHNIAAALIDCIMLVVAVAWCWYEFKEINVWAGHLIVPYLLWGCFATYLTTSLLILNGPIVDVNAPPKQD